MCEGGRDPRRGRGQRRGWEAAARGVRGRLSPGSSAHGEAAARWQQCGRRAGGRSGRWGDGVAWCCDSGVLCACIVIVCIHQQQGMVVVWRALVGRAGASLGDRRVDVSPGSGVRADSTPAALEAAGGLCLVCGRGCGGRDDEAGWLAGCHGGDGRAPSVRTRTLRELSLGRVSVASLGGANEVVYHPEVVRWSSGRRRPRPLGGQRSLVLVGAEHATAAGRLGRPRR